MRANDPALAVVYLGLPGDDADGEGADDCFPMASGMSDSTGGMSGQVSQAIRHLISSAGEAVWLIKD